jgi:hypothetical protein
MIYRITIMTTLSRAVLDDRLLRLSADGPFHVGDLTPVDAGLWAFAVQPVRPGMAVGFSKVAELLVLLAREFDVQSVDRLPLRAISAAS